MDKTIAVLMNALTAMTYRKVITLLTFLLMLTGIVMFLLPSVLDALAPIIEGMF